MPRYLQTIDAMRPDERQRDAIAHIEAIVRGRRELAREQARGRPNVNRIDEIKSGIQNDLASLVDYCKPKVSEFLKGNMDLLPGSKKAASYGIFSFNVTGRIEINEHTRHLLDAIVESVPDAEGIGGLKIFASDGDSLKEIYSHVPVGKTQTLHVLLSEGEFKLMVPSQSLVAELIPEVIMSQDDSTLVQGDYWYTAEDIDTLLKRELEGRAEVMGAVYPLLKITDSDAHNPKRDFNTLIESTLKSVLETGKPCVIPVNTIRQTLTVHQLSSYALDKFDRGGCARYSRATCND